MSLKNMRSSYSDVSGYAMGPYEAVWKPHLHEEAHKLWVSGLGLRVLDVMLPFLVHCFRMCHATLCWEMPMPAAHIK